MKQLLMLLFIATLSSCTGCMADYSQRLSGVRKVCPNCTYVLSEGRHYAVDTSKQPNIIYTVIFCNGVYPYKAWEVDHLVRVN